MSRWLATAVAAALAFGAATASGSAHAFNRSDTFSIPAEMGGGGGRRFTGAPGDGLTCVVCHRLGRSHPVLTISGMPTVFVPGTRYDVVVEWPEAPDNAALAFELATASGHGAGDVTLLDAAALEPRDLCSDGSPAAHVATDVGDRRVVTLDACGASRLRVQWTAPSAPDPIWMNAALVQGNGSGDPSGDGVTERSQLVAAEGFGADVSSFDGGCTTTRRSRHDARSASLALAAACLAAVRVRRRRGRRERGRHGR